MEEKPIKKITLGVVLVWAFSCLFMLSGLGQLGTTPVSGIFTSLAGLSIFPPFIEFLRTKARVEMSKAVRVVIFIALIVLSGVALPKKDNSANPVETATPIAAEVKTEEVAKPIASPTSNPEIVAGAAYTDAFLTNVYPLMISANEKISAGGNAGANYDFGTAETEIRAGLADYKSAQTKLKAIKPIPQGLINVNTLITRALVKYIEGAQKVLAGVENYDADMISAGNEIYKQGTTLINQATEEIKAYNAAAIK